MTLEEELLRKSLTGDNNALADLVEIYRPYITKIAGRYLRNNKSDIEDVIQESLITIMKCIGDYKDFGKEFKNWVGGIVANTCKIFIRKNVRRKRRESVVGNEIKEYYEKKDKETFVFEDVISLLEKLPKEEAEIIRLKYYHDMSYDDISKELNINQNTLRSKVSRCFVELRRKIKMA